MWRVRCRDARATSWNWCVPKAPTSSSAKTKSSPISKLKKEWHSIWILCIIRVPSMIWPWRYQSTTRPTRICLICTIWLARLRTRSSGNSKNRRKCSTTSAHTPTAKSKSWSTRSTNNSKIQKSSSRRRARPTNSADSDSSKLRSLSKIKPCWMTWRFPMPSPSPRRSSRNRLPSISPTSKASKASLNKISKSKIGQKITKKNYNSTSPIFD